MSKETGNPDQDPTATSSGGADAERLLAAFKLLDAEEQQRILKGVEHIGSEQEHSEKRKKELVAELKRLDVATLEEALEYAKRSARSDSDDARVDRTLDELRKFDSDDFEKAHRKLEHDEGGGGDADEEGRHPRHLEVLRGLHLPTLAR